MVEQTVPIKLHQLCNLLVRKHHAQHGLGNLVNLLVKKDNLVVLASESNTFTVIGTGVSSFRIRKLSWAAGLVFIGLGVFVNRWFLVGLLLCFLVDRWAGRMERDSYFYQASYLLALEMLVQDLAGWGRAFP